MEIFLLFETVDLGLDLCILCLAHLCHEILSNRLRAKINTLFSNTTAEVRLRN